MVSKLCAFKEDSLAVKAWQGIKETQMHFVLDIKRDILCYFIFYTYNRMT